MSWDSQLTVFAGKPLNSADKILKVAQANGKEVNRIQEEDLAIIDVRGTMTELASIGPLVMIADKMSDGFHCNQAVKRIMGSYQDFVKDCDRALVDFRLSAKSALELHGEACESLGDEDFQDALEKVGECKEYSTKMAKTSGELVTAAGVLVAHATDALEKATEQDIKNQAQKREIEKAQQETKAAQAEAAMLDKQYEEEVRQYRKKEEAAIARAEKESDKAFTIAIIGAVAEGLKGAASIGTTAAMVYTGAAVPAAGAQGLAAAFAPPPQPGAQPAPPAPAAVQAVQPDPKVEKIAELNVQKEETAEQILAKKEEIEEAEKNGAEKEEIDKLKQQKEKLEILNTTLDKQVKDFQGALDKVYQLSVDNAASAEANAIRIAGLLDEKRKLEIANKGKMARLAQEFANNIENLDDVKVTIEMMKNCIRALGMIRTALVKTQRFWEDQGRACETLTALAEKAGKALEKASGDAAEKAKARCIKNFKKVIVKSGFTWLCLFKINHEAQALSAKAYKDINKIMSNIGGMQSRQSRLVEAKDVLNTLSMTWSGAGEIKKIC